MTPTPLQQKGLDLLADIRKRQEAKNREWEKRPRPTISQVSAFVEAKMRGEYVNDEIRLEREATCEDCEHCRHDYCGSWCSICGCGTSDESRRVFNLARHVELMVKGKPIPKYGCKHPKRKDGKGWKR